MPLAELGGLPVWELPVLSGVALAAGFIDSMAGGGGLLTLPALLWTGLSPAQALATNKLQSSFGSLSASVHFIRAKIVSPRRLLPAIAATALGAGAGAFAVQTLDPSLLRTVVPVLLLAVAVFVMISPRLGAELRPPRLSPPAYALLIAPALGFYDGFFGPGTGSFIVISQVVLLGLELTQATARTKLLNFTSNAASLLLFVFGGQIQWAVGFSMALGQILGARLGTHLVIRTEARVVRPLLVVISVVLSCKLLFADAASPLHRIFAP